MDYNANILSSQYSSEKEIQAAIRNEAILVQTKRIRKNSTHSNPNLRQSGSNNSNLPIIPRNDEQMPTVTHRIRIGPKKRYNKSSDHNHNKGHSSSYIDRLYETNSYKSNRAQDGDYEVRRRKERSKKMPKESEDIESLSNSSNINSNDTRNFDIELERVERASRPRNKTKRPKHRDFEETKEIGRISNDAPRRKTKDIKTKINSEKSVLAKKKINKAKQGKTVKPDRQPEYLDFTSFVNRYGKPKGLKIVPKLQAVSERNFSSVSVNVDPSVISSKQSDNLSIWNIVKLRGRKAQTKTRIPRSDSLLSVSRLPDDFSSSSTLRRYGRKECIQHFRGAAYLERHFSSFKTKRSLFRNLKNWALKKVYDAEVKRVSVFREKNKFCVLSESETEIDLGNIPQYGDQWLEFTGSDTSFDQDVAEKENRKSNFHLICNEESYYLYNSLKWYFKILATSGRMPFEMYKEDKVVKFRVNRKSWSYILFCITTIFLTLISGIFSIEFMKMYNRPFSRKVNLSTTEKLDKEIFNKYWLYGLIVLFYMLHTVLWSFSLIFQYGIHLEEYLTRWHLALSVIKYSPDASVKDFLIWHLAFLALCSTVATILFFFENQYWSLFWGNGELIAVLLFKTIIRDPRSHHYFYWMRIFGHCLYLYSMYCSKMITIMILVHCRLVEMISRRWNLRIGCVLKKIAIVEEGTDAYTIKTRVIPYMKLFAEHIVITSFSRHTGKVFAIAAIIYYIFKGITMFLSLYMLAQYYLQRFPIYDTMKSEGKSKEYNTNEEDFQILTDIFIVMQCWIGFVITSESINKAGSVIMNGYDFVRRHGMVLCRSSYERRFILSLQNVFAPVHDYYINFGFKVDREFIYNFSSAVIGFCITATLFSPIRWKIENIIQCNRNGTCVHFSFYRLFSRDQVFRSSIDAH